MKAVVVDTSVVVKLFVEEADSDLARAAVAAHRCHAPELLLLETSSVLGRLVRSKHLDRDEALDAIETVDRLVTIHSATTPPRRLLDLALDLQHASHDVTFLALAMSMDVPLLTADEVFARKVIAARVPAQVATLKVLP